MPTPLPRRGFFSRIAAGTAAFSAAYGIPSVADAQPSEQAQSHELDKWLDDLKGQHKQVFDCVTVARIGDMMFARNFLTANASDYGLKDEDSSVIVSLRHEATMFGFGDAMWEKYKIGEAMDVPQGGGRGGRGASADTARPPRATRNPQLQMINALAARGAHFTVCGMATTRRAGEFARALGLQAADVRADLVANMVPNCRVVAAGIVLINRAQERGFTFAYVG
jgi:hypothetical protein